MLPFANLPSDEELAALDDSPPAAFIGDDNQAVKQITRHTSLFGRVVYTILAGGIVVLAVFAYKSNQAEEHKWDFKARAEAAHSDEEAAGVLRDELGKTQDDEVKEFILRNLAHLHDTASLPLFIAALDDPGPVRASAALAIAALGSPAADQARDKLLTVLPQTTELDHARVVWALAVLHESRASNEVLAAFTAGLLQGQPGFDPKVIVDVIGSQRLGAPEMTGHREKPVRVLVAAALSEAAGTEAVEPLIRMLQDQDQDVVRLAASGLGRTGDPRAAQPLFDLLQRQPSMRSGVFDSIRKTTGAPALAALVSACRNPDHKRELVRMLADTRDDRAANTLATLLQDPEKEIRVTSAIGLAELGDARAATALVTLAQDEDQGVADDALDALYQLRSREAAPGLITMLGDEVNFLGRRAAVLHALGASGAPEAGAAIMGKLSGDDVGAAARALAELNYEPAYARLRAMIARPRNVDFSQPNVANEEAFRNRQIAIQAMGIYGRPDAAADLMHVIEDVQDDLRLRSDAGDALGHIANAEITTQILQKAQDAHVDEQTREFYVQGLWYHPSRETSHQVLALLGQTTPPPIRRAAALAVGYAGDPANDDQLSTLLDNNETRREAAFAVLLSGSDALATKLVGILGDDHDLRDLLQTEVTSRDSDRFNVLTQGMFTSGQIWRRLRVAQILAVGEGNDHFGFASAQLITRLKEGWDRAGGITAREIRAKLFETLTGADENMRGLAGEMLQAMGERGLLIRARDAGGNGAAQARDALRDQTPANAL